MKQISSFVTISLTIHCTKAILAAAEDEDLINYPLSSDSGDDEVEYFDDIASQKTTTTPPPITRRIQNQKGNHSPNHRPRIHVGSPQFFPNDDEGGLPFDLGGFGGSPFPGTREVQFVEVRVGEPCPQILIESGKAIGNEDCLHLNIYVPNEMVVDPIDFNRQPKKFPVLVWFHGESIESFEYRKLSMLSSGSAKDLDPFIFLQNKIIVVTPQYRLGSLGFLSATSEV